MAEKVWIPAFTGMTEKDVGRITTSFPIPAHAGVYGRKSLDPRLRGNDGTRAGMTVQEVGMTRKSQVAPPYGRWALPGEWRHRAKKNATLGKGGIFSRDDTICLAVAPGNSLPGF